jgi:hypothetical protein
VSLLSSPPPPPPLPPIVVPASLLLATSPAPQVSKPAASSLAFTDDNAAACECHVTNATCQQWRRRTTPRQQQQRAPPRHSRRQARRTQGGRRETEDTRGGGQVDMGRQGWPRRFDFQCVCPCLPHHPLTYHLRAPAQPPNPITTERATHTRHVTRTHPPRPPCQPYRETRGATRDGGAIPPSRSLVRMPPLATSPAH